MNKLLVGFAWLAILITNSSCGMDSPDSNNPAVRYILPNGFRGVFKFVRDPDKGIDVKINGDVFTYRIPESGVLVLKSFKPFRRFHEESAFYIDGTKIPLNDHDGADKVALYGLFGDADTFWLLIGTEQESFLAWDKIPSEIEIGGAPTSTDSKTSDHE